jgi:hypothetical protein
LKTPSFLLGAKHFVDSAVDSLSVIVFSSDQFEMAMSGEIGCDADAEGATAPETLRQKNRVALTTSGK